MTVLTPLLAALVNFFDLNIGRGPSGEHSLPGRYAVTQGKHSNHEIRARLHRQARSLDQLSDR